MRIFTSYFFSKWIISFKNTQKWEKLAHCSDKGNQQKRWNTVIETGKKLSDYDKKDLLNSVSQCMLI